MNKDATTELPRDSMTLGSNPNDEPFSARNIPNRHNMNKDATAESPSDSVTVGSNLNDDTLVELRETYVKPGW